MHPGTSGRRPAAWLGLGLALCAGLVSAPAATRELPSHWCGRHIIVTAWVGGDEARPLELLLDTGATHTVIDPDALRRVSPDTRLKVGDTFRFERLDLGEVKIRRAPGWLQELDEIGHTLGHPIDGILGYPTLQSVVLTLDYPARQVRITTEGGSLAPGDEVLRLQRGRRRPWISLEWGGRRVDVLVDSGSGQGFTVKAKDRVDWAVAPRVVSGLTGFEGVEAVAMGRLAGDLRLGTTIFARPIVRFVEEDKRLLGAQVLEQFVVTVDGPGRRIRFARPDGAAGGVVEAAPKLGYGLGFRAHREALEVVYRVPDGPGAEAGLRVGDRVVAIDGVPVAERGCGFEWQAAAERELTVERDGVAAAWSVRLTRAVLVP